MNKFKISLLLTVMVIHTAYSNITDLGNNIGNTIDSITYHATRPSTTDYRVKSLIAIGAILVATGTCATLLGSYRASQNAGQTDENHQPVGIIADSIARLSGLGTALLGIVCTVGGGATIVLAQEAIFRLQSFLVKQCPQQG